jgi:RNA polymerase sigma-B factor
MNSPSTRSPDTVTAARAYGHAVGVEEPPWGSRGSRSAEDLLTYMNRLDEDDPLRERVRAELVDLHTPLARRIARRYAHRGEATEDLEQAAFLGLVKAINRYDPDLGDNFLAYATPMMNGEVKRHFRDRAWSVHMPRPLQELSLALPRTVQGFVQRNGRSPTTSEIAELLEITEEQAVEAIAAWDSYRPVSLDAPAGDDNGRPGAGGQHRR